MRRSVQVCGALMALLGVGGVIDRIIGVPLLGPAATALRRHVLPHVDLLVGHELYAHLMVCATGVVLIIAAERWEPRPGQPAVAAAARNREARSSVRRGRRRRSGC